MSMEEVEFDGSINKIIFHNEKNAYTVFTLETKDGELTCVGTLPCVNTGESIKVRGNYIFHPNFGQQLNLTSFEKIIPESIEAIYKYLASGAVRGIGKVTAKRLVESFGKDTLDILENSPESLLSIKGMTKKRADKIFEEYKKISGMQSIVIALSQYGLSLNQAVKVYKEWGDSAKQILNLDPYALCGEPFEFSFEKAEEVAVNLKFDMNSKTRARAGILHILKHNQTNGHTCLPKDKLIAVTSDFLGIAEKDIVEILHEMNAGNLIKICKFDEREYIFTLVAYDCEMYIASRINMMIKYPAQAMINCEKEIEKIEKSQNIQYDEVQKEAICTALGKGMLVLTGGPGTGKTTTLNAIINLLESKGQKVLLCAPTGRAAQRMKELTGKNAKTIHRLLDVGYGNSDKISFMKNEKNLLSCDALIIDELSMVDAYLFSAVLKALPLGCRLILVGDNDQLPCIGPGNLLMDLQRSSVVPVVTLKKIFRQSSESLIVTNAHKIISGNMPDLQVKDNDFFFMERKNADDLQNTIVQLCANRLKAKYNFDDFDIQVLAPSKKGKLGTVELNKKLQEIINAKDESKVEVKINNTIFRQGDKVMQIKNDYDVIYDRKDGSSSYGIFNGDIGNLEDINLESELLTVCFDDKTAYYSFEQAQNLDLAFAITVHKSQGSEFEAVIIPTYNVPFMLSYRNLLYTAVTRAKKMVILVGNIATVENMVNNNKKMNRYTGLEYFLEEKFKV